MRPAGLLWAGAIVAAVVLGAAMQGCSHKTPHQEAHQVFQGYQKRIREVVQDPARAQQMIDITEELQRQVNVLRAQLAESRADVDALNANYNATRAEFDAFFKQQDADRKALSDEAVAVRVRVSKLLTESEWESLRKYGLEVIEADLKELSEK